MTAHTTVTLKSGVTFIGASITTTADTFQQFAEYQREIYTGLLNTSGALKIFCTDGTYGIAAAADVESLVCTLDTP